MSISLLVSSLLLVNVVVDQEVSEKEKARKSIVSAGFTKDWKKLKELHDALGSFKHPILPTDKTDVLSEIIYFARADSFYAAVLTSVRLMREYGADADGSGSGWPLTHAATVDRYGKIVRRLLSYGANVNGGSEAVPLCGANTQNAKILLDAGADPNRTWPKRLFTPLQMAALYRSVARADLLIQGGAKLDTQDVDGATALHYAVQTDCSAKPEWMKAMIEFLLKAGANPRIKDKKGRTPLAFARELKNKAAISALSKKPIRN